MVGEVDGDTVENVGDLDGSVVVGETDGETDGNTVGSEDVGTVEGHIVVKCGSDAVDED